MAIHIIFDEIEAINNNLIFFDNNHKIAFCDDIVIDIPDDYYVNLICNAEKILHLCAIKKSIIENHPKSIPAGYMLSFNMERGLYQIKKDDKLFYYFDFSNMDSSIIKKYNLDRIELPNYDIWLSEGTAEYWYVPEYRTGDDMIKFARNYDKGLNTGLINDNDFLAYLVFYASDFDAAKNMINNEYNDKVDFYCRLLYIDNWDFFVENVNSHNLYSSINGEMLLVKKNNYFWNDSINNTSKVIPSAYAYVKIKDKIIEKGIEK